MSKMKNWALFGFLLLFILPACAIRPARHMSYAEAAYQAAQLANAESQTPALFQEAKENLFRARAAYRLKDFREAHRLAIRTRRYAERAEFKSLNSDSDASDNPESL